MNQVHPYTFRNDDQFLHFDFNVDPYKEYDFWINKMNVDGLFTDFPKSLHNFQKWTSPQSLNDQTSAEILHEIAKMISSNVKE